METHTLRLTYKQKPSETLAYTQHYIQEAAHFSATLPKLYITKNATISKQ